MIDGSHRRDAMLKKTNDNSLLRKNIEDAIRNSLDPLSAKRALDSLHPVLKDLSVTDGRTDGRLLRNTGSRDRQQPSLQQIREKEKDYHSRRKHDQRVTLPSIQSILSDYRKNSPVVNLPAVPHLRSVSEPIRVVEMFPRNVLQQNNLSQNVLHQNLAAESSSSRSQLQVNSSRNILQDHYPKLLPKDTSYNADAAVSLLRLERITRRPDFSAFWDWKMNNTGVLNNGESGDLSKISSKNPLSKDQLEREIAIYMGDVQDSTGKKRKESKVQRVKRMKEAYSRTPDPNISRSSDDVDDSSVASSVRTGAYVRTGASGVSGVSGAKHNTPSSAVNNNQHNQHNQHNNHLRHKGSITDLDMITISKYFIINDDLSLPGSANGDKRSQSPSLMQRQTLQRVKSREGKVDSPSKQHIDSKKPMKSKNHNGNNNSNNNDHNHNNNSNNNNGHNNQFVTNPKHPGTGTVTEYNNSDVMYQLDNTILDKSIVHRDIDHKEDTDFNYPFPYYSFSPSNSKPASPLSVNKGGGSKGGNKKDVKKKSSVILTSLNSNHTSHNNMNNISNVNNNPNSNHSNNSNNSITDTNSRETLTPHTPLTPHSVFSRSGTPSDDFYGGGGIDGLLDWTRALDCDV